MNNKSWQSYLFPIFIFLILLHGAKNRWHEREKFCSWARCIAPCFLVQSFGGSCCMPSLAHQTCWFYPGEWLSWGQCYASCRGIRWNYTKHPITYQHYCPQVLTIAQDYSWSVRRSPSQMFCWGHRSNVSKHCHSSCVCKLSGKPNQVIFPALLCPSAVMGEPFEKLMTECVNQVYKMYPKPSWKPYGTGKLPSDIEIQVDQIPLWCMEGLGDDIPLFFFAHDAAQGSFGFSPDFLLYAKFTESHVFDSKISERNEFIKTPDPCRPTRWCHVHVIIRYHSSEFRNELSKSHSQAAVSIW